MSVLPGVLPPTLRIDRERTSHQYRCSLIYRGHKSESMQVALVIALVLCPLTCNHRLSIQKLTSILRFRRNTPQGILVPQNTSFQYVYADTPRVSDSNVSVVPVDTYMYMDADMRAAGMWC